jgi:hypothetical protein
LNTTALTTSTEFTFKDLLYIAPVVTEFSSWKLNSSYEPPLVLRPQSFITNLENKSSFFWSNKLFVRHQRNIRNYLNFSIPELLTSALEVIDGCIIEDIGGGVIAVKTRSRDKIVRVIKILERRNLLVPT